MPAPRNRRHILVPGEPVSEPFTSRGSGGPKPFPRPPDRVQHARHLAEGLTRAQAEVAAVRANAVVPPVEPLAGILVSFQSPPGIELKLDSLENKTAGIEVRGVTRREEQGQLFVETATVFIPEGKVGHFLGRFEEYATEQTPKGAPRHSELVDRIASVRLTTLQALWTDDLGTFPPDDAIIWWEVWLRRREDHEGREIDKLVVLAREANLAVGARRLLFEDRSVCLVRGTPQQLAGSLLLLDDLAELRRAKTGAAFFVDLTATEQAEWAQDLLDRSTPPPADAPAVCILDTGVTQAHPLIAPGLAIEDATAVNAAWGAHDNGGGPTQAGHGTVMAGLALYGDLAPVLESQDPVVLRHKLESVKILPPVGANDPELYGAVTAAAVARPEIQAPQRRRVFSMAVSAPADGERGQPTSWSAAVDALAAGRSIDAATDGLVYLDDGERHGRLFVLAAGNITEDKFNRNHLNICDTEAVQDPAHAWNALTVGACTDKVLIAGAGNEGWTPVAAAGELAPFSSTGVLLSSKWPNKPDVVFEGGNVGTDGNAFDPGIPNLCLLSTFHRPIERLLVHTNATSAATAQVARIAAMVSAEYPQLWPETLRALVVHSAEWTPLMRTAIDAAQSREAVGALLHRYGFGVPGISRALRSADDALTLVSQSVIHPYQDKKTREMNLHELPWPTEVLQGLGEQKARLRITLSYFIEPNAARRGWRTKHRYASHGLRFDVKTGTESVVEFRRRINKRTDEDGEKPTTESDSKEWLLGSQLRHRGSLHSDIWEGTAAALADRAVIAVYPVSGWWKEQPKRDRSEFGARYALIVSIQTDAEDVDIWTPVAQQLEVPIQNEVEW